MTPGSARKFGAAADWIVGADVVLADGSLVRADQNENPNLFWALRGGGGNFGVIVSLGIRLVLVPKVVGGEMFWPADRASEVLRFYRDWSSALTNETSTVFRIVAVPPTPDSPREIRGRTVCMIGVCHADPETADAVFAPLRELGTPLLSDVRSRSVGSMAGLDPASHIAKIPSYGQFEYFQDLSDDVIDNLVRTAKATMPPLVQFEVQQFGGNLFDGSGASQGAFQRSSASYALHVESSALHATLPELAKATTAAFAALGDVYTGQKNYNFLRGDEQGEVARAFASSTLERLRAIKERFDPAYFFRLNINIAPKPVLANDHPVQRTERDMQS